MSPKKKTLGRRKIEIKKVEKKSQKQVTFSKRRSGLFKKAAELSVLCGAEVAIIVFSPTAKVYSFAHPNVHTLLDRFFNGNLDPSPSPSPSLPADVPIADFNQDFVEATRELEMEKKRAEEAMNNNNNNGQFWWDIDEIQNMGLEELKQYRSALQELRAKVSERAENMAALRTTRQSPLPSMPPSPPLFSIFEDNYPDFSAINGFGLGYNF